MKGSLVTRPVILVLVIPQFALAGIENRPGNVDDAYVMDQGTGYVAVGYAYARYPDDSKQYDIPVNAGYGLTDSLEITLGIPYTKIDPGEDPSEKGMGDLAIRPEWAFLKETDSTPQVSLALTVKFDTGNRAIGSGTTDYGAFLNLSKELGRISLHGNLGYNVLEDSNNSFFLGASLNYSAKNSLTLIGEIWTEVPEDSGTDQVTEILGGATYDLSDSITLDVGIGTGFHAEDVDLRYTMGATFLF